MTRLRVVQRKGNRAKKSEVNQHELILGHREMARRIARHLLNRWRVVLPKDEIDSAADFALCEAATGFNPAKGTQFGTYLFYFIKGTLINTIRSNTMSMIGYERDVSEEVTSESIDGSCSLAGHDNADFQEAAVQETASPERQTYLNELRDHCNKALASLNSLERKILLNVHVLDFKVASVARKIGYSRGHTSTIKTIATRKMRAELKALLAA